MDLKIRFGMSSKPITSHSDRNINFSSPKGEGFPPSPKGTLNRGLIAAYNSISGFVALSRNQNQKALDAFFASLDLGHKGEEPWEQETRAYLWSGISMAHLNLGEIPAAQEHANKSLAISKRLQSPNWRAEYVLGRCLEIQGEYSAAEAKYADAMRNLEEGANRIGAFHEKKSYVAQGQFIVDAYETLKVQREALPPNLLVESIEFRDADSYLPNDRLDGGEKATIVARITNGGQGTAFAVEMNVSTSSAQIELTEDIPLGDIFSGEERMVEIPVSVSLDATDGQASFLFEIKEKRGYDAPKGKLVLDIAKLDRPDLEILQCNLNDESGLADGNGNGIPENGETIELVCYLKNQGVGNARQVALKLDNLEPGLEMVQGEEDIAFLSPSQVTKARLAFNIPRAFDASQIALRLSARDAIGASEAKRELVFPFKQVVPVLAYDYRLYDQEGNEVHEVRNGAHYRLEVVPSNIGKNTSRNVELEVRPQQGDIQLDRTRVGIGEIRPGQRMKSESFYFTVPRNFPANEASFHVSLTQEEFNSKTALLTLPASLRQPDLVVSQEVLDTNGNGRIEQGESIRLRVRVENRGNLDAKGVRVNLEVPKKWVEFREEKALGRILPGQSETAEFLIVVRRRAEVGDLAFNLKVDQSDGFPLVATNFNERVYETGVQVTRIDSKAQAAPLAVAGAGAASGGKPLIVIAYPLRDGIVNQDRTLFDGTVTATGRGKTIDSIVVEVNGRKLRTVTQESGGQADDFIRIEKLGSKQVRFRGYVPLSMIGENRINVEASDSDNLISQETMSIVRQKAMGTLWALIIGISEYRNPKLSLSYAHRDAESFYEFLRSPKGGQLDDDHIRLLTNRTATRENILKEFYTFLRKPRREDTVIVFMALHGLVEENSLYYLNYDADPDIPQVTAIPSEEILKIVQNEVKAGKVVMYLDACHAGLSGLSPQVAMRGIQITEINKQISNLASAMAKARNGVAIFSASSSLESSREGVIWGGGHGVFTYCLLQGLKGEADRDANKKVTIYEIDDYLRQHVTKHTDGKQRPELKGNYDKNMPLAIIE
jgi:tetratricopeptide (TPR) repeat protein